MNKVFALFIALIIAPLTIQAADFKEGVNYKVVKQTATAKPEVIEFFSFYCPHCLKLEPLMLTLQDNLPEGVPIKKNHVDFIGKDNGVLLTRAYAAAELLQVEHKVSEIIFDDIHTKNKRNFNEADVLAIFEKAGISQQEAKSALASFPVSGLASQMKRNTETFQIRGVPTLIVNGKYQVVTSSVKNTEEFIELVNYLVAKKN